MKKLILLSVLLVPLASAQTLNNQTLTLHHDEGTTTVPLNPKRVVVLDEEMLGWLYALGLSDRVVGLATGSRLQPGDIGADGFIKPEVQKRGFLALGNVSKAKFAGSWTAPNLETILSLRPDLILRSTWAGNQNYANLSKIAPTVGYSSATPGYWRVPFRKVAAIFGQQAKAEAVIKQVSDTRRANALKLSAAKVFNRYPKVVAISPFAGGTNYVATKVRVIEDLRSLGFQDGYKPTGAGIKGTSEVISDEALLGLDKKTLVVLYPPAGQYDGLKNFMNSPAGQRLKNQIVVYERPDFAPWSGPLVSIDASNALTQLILEKTK